MITTLPPADFFMWFFVSLFFVFLVDTLVDDIRRGKKPPKQEEKVEKYDKLKWTKQ